MSFFIIAVILIGGCLGFGKSADHYGSAPPNDATLWEKAEWEQNHGSVSLCSAPLETVGPLTLISSKNSTISMFIINLSLASDSYPIDMTNVSILLSTATAEKKLRLGDPSVNITWFKWNGSAMINQNKIRDNLLDRADLMHIELDTIKMGFTNSTLGPGQKFSFLITPAGCHRYQITEFIPNKIEPTMTMRIPY
jgi:archaellin